MSKALSANQKTFNKVVRALRKQNCKSLNSNGSCAYRGVNGLRCAAGHLITNKEYRKDFETIRARYGMVAGCLKKLGHDPVLADELQHIHDSYLPGEWEMEFTAVATRWHLTVPKLDDDLRSARTTEDPA